MGLKKTPYLCRRIQDVFDIRTKEHIINIKKVRIMTKIAKQLTELVGNTPLLELNKYSQAKGLETPVIAKA